MPALGTFIAGPYTLTLDGQAIGLLDPQGERGAVELLMQSFLQTIQGHAYAMTPIDAVHRGADWRINFIAEEQVSGALKSFSPFSSTASASYAFGDAGVPGQVGRLATTIGTNLVLTAVAGTTAAAAPATLTALVYPTDETRSFMMDAVLRKFPCSLRCMLQAYSGTNRFWLAT
jgi:hypothetical protein